MSQFHISDENPNDLIGGGGCLGNGDTSHEDCEPPYVIFYASSTDSMLSPHAVLCSRCLAEVASAVLTPAEEEVIEGEATEVSLDDVPEV